MKTSLKYKGLLLSVLAVALLWSISLSASAVSWYGTTGDTVPSGPVKAIVVVSAMNGSITYSPGAPLAGDTVTLTAKPLEGYRLSSIRVLNGNDEELPLTRKAGGGYTFTLPDAYVVVRSHFEKITPRTFNDVPATSKFYDAVSWAVDEGIAKGTGGGAFSPSNTCTHNHILTFIWRANNSPAAEGGTDFARAASWAKTAGLADSVTGSAYCTRAQAMVYLWKLEGSPKVKVTDTFTDVAEDAPYAQAVAWAVEQGITNGKTKTTFDPNGTCTRGQIATFLYRYFN